MKKIFLLAASAAILTNCTATAPDMPSHHSILVGVPVLAAAYYSATQVSTTKALITPHVDDRPTRYDAALIDRAGEAPDMAKARKGQPVTIYGTGMLGQPIRVKTVVIGQAWACDGRYSPDVHVEPGYCTKRGRGYSYGFIVDRNGIRPGFSGGGAYDASGRLLGIVVQVGRTDDGRDVAFLYHIADLQSAFNF